MLTLNNISDDKLSIYNYVHISKPTNSFSQMAWVCRAFAACLDGAPLTYSVNSPAFGDSSAYWKLFGFRMSKEISPFIQEVAFHSVGARRFRLKANSVQRPVCHQAFQIFSPQSSSILLQKGQRLLKITMGCVLLPDTRHP